MRADLVGRGVKVTSVEPGNTETEFALVRFKGDQEKAASIYETKEGPRLGCTGEDMAKIVYFATDEVGNDEELKKEFGASCTATKC